MQVRRGRLDRSHRQILIFHGSSTLVGWAEDAPDIDTRPTGSPGLGDPTSTVKIIHRYVLREHAGPLTFALTALTSLLLLNYVAKQFGTLVGKGLPMGVIGEFVLLSLPFTVAMTLPMSVLVATLYAFSRLSAENEITALKASGVSLKRLLIPVIVAASALSIGMIAFNDQVLPRTNHRLRNLQADIARKKPTFGLREQTLNEVSARRYFIVANHLERDNRMREVTIYDFSDPLRRRTIHADSGELAFDRNGTDLLLTLYDGVMLEVPRQNPDRLQRLYFEKDFVRVKEVANQLEVTRDANAYGKSDREMSVCELQNEVARYEHELARSQDDLAQILLAATREAVSGVPAEVPELRPVDYSIRVPGGPAPRSQHLTLGRLYCDALQFVRQAVSSVFAAMPGTVVQSLHAATPNPAGEWSHGAKGVAFVQDTAAAQDTTQGRVDSALAGKLDTATSTIGTLALPRDSAMRARAAALQASAFPTAAPPPTSVSSVIESARMRVAQDLRAINTNAVELHKKFAISVACVVFVLVGAPIALRFPRGGVGLVIGASLAIFGIYYVGLIAGEALADRAILTPFWAMWGANILLTAVAAVLLARMGREGATARGGDLAELLDVLRAPFRRRMRGAGRDAVPSTGGA